MHIPYRFFLFIEVSLAGKASSEVRYSNSHGLICSMIVNVVLYDNELVFDI